VVQACKKGLFNSCPKITATFTPRPGAVIWSGPFKDCSPFQYKPNPDLPPGKEGGPITCTLEATSPTNGWVVASAGITGPCGSIKAVTSGHAEFAACAGTYASDYYTILPEGIGVIDGTVTEKDGKTPIAGIAVQVRSSDNHRSVAYTDHTGYYSAYVDKGTYTICPCLFKDPRYNEGAPDNFTPRSPTISVSGHQTQDFVEGGWQIAGKLSRKVQHKDDPPLSGIVIGIVGKGSFYREAATDAAGRYAITLPEGSYVVEGLTPPQVRSGESIEGAAWQCADGGVVSHTAACILQLSADHNCVDFQMNNQYKVKLTESAKLMIPNRNVRKIKAKVTNSQGHGVAGKKVKFKVTPKPGAQVVIATPEGQTLWSSIGAAAGAAAGTFTLPTKGGGSIEVVKWGGAQSGAKVEAAVDEGDDSSPSADASDTLDDDPPHATAGPPLPSDIADILERGVHGRLGARPAPSSGPAALQFNIYNSLNDLADTGNADFEPVRSADDKTSGIVVYPRNTDARAIQDIAAFLAGTGPTPPSPAVSGAQVIDMDEVSKVVKDPSSNRVIPSRLQPLSAWVQAHPKSVEGLMNRANEAGISSGRLHRNMPKPHAVQRSREIMRSLGTSFPGHVVKVRGPLVVRATVRAPKTGGGPKGVVAESVGKTAGLKRGGPIVMDIPGAEVVRYAGLGSSIKLAAAGIGVQPVAAAPGPDDADYYLPEGAGYDLEFEGTGSGSATVTIGTDGNSTSFTVNSSAGRTGSAAINDDSAVPETATFAGSTVKPDAGPRLKLEGAPARMTVGVPQHLVMHVLDPSGRPLGATRVDLGSKDFFVRGFTEEDGAVSFDFTPVGTAPVGIRAIEPGFTDAIAKPRLDPAPSNGSGEARRLAASMPTAPLTTVKEFVDPFTVIVVTMVLALIVATVILVRRRRDLLRALGP